MGKVTDSNNIDFESLLNDESLVRTLESLGLNHISDISLLLALDSLSPGFHGITILEQFANEIGKIYSPFTPNSRLEYSIQIHSDLDSTGGKEVSSASEYMVRVEIPGASLCSSIILPFIVDESFEIELDAKKILENITTLPKVRRTFDSNLNEVSPRKYPFLKEILGKLSDIQRDVIIRRNGLIFGKPETLESIGQDFDLSRERIRQIEARAWRRFRHRSPEIKTFKKYLECWVKKQVNVVSSYEIEYQFAKYLDFGDYVPATSLAFLCSYANLSVQLLNGDSQCWYAASSDKDRDCFEEIYTILHTVQEEETRSNNAIAFVDIQDALKIARRIHMDLIRSAHGVAQRIVGSSKVMRLDEFLSCLIKTIPQIKCLIEEDDDALIREQYGYYLILKLAGVSLVKAAEYERMVFGDWVTIDLTKHARSIVRAIIYHGANEDRRVDGDSLSYLRAGVRSDYIIRDIFNHTGLTMNEHSLAELCKRSPEIFVRSNDISWGLIGCGAIKQSAEVPKRHYRGQSRIIDLITSALEDSPDSLHLQDIVQIVRNTIPNASETTIRLYLNTLHRHRFEANMDGTFRLSREYENHLIDMEQGTVLDLLVEVLGQADYPLNIEQIIERCLAVRFVSETAIRAYLIQNYGGLFRRVEDTYSLS